MRELCIVSIGVGPSKRASHEVRPMGADGMAELTIGELLNLPLIQAAEPTVYVGADQLDCTVRWVHSGEISDIASFIVGGEMLLTAGLGIGNTDAEQRD